MTAGMRRIFVPALVILLGTILLPMAGCRIVHNDQRVSTASTSAESAFDAAAYVDKAWDSKLMPYFASKATELGTVIEAIKKNPDEAGKQYGLRADTEGSPWTFPVKAKATVLSVNTASRAGTLVVEIATEAGKQEVTLQIGPVVKGSAIRDTVPFFSFENVTNQIEFAQVGRACNDRALKQIQSVLPQLKAGVGIGFFASISVNEAPETYVAMPISIKLLDGGAL